MNHELKRKITEHACHALGFDACGVASPYQPPERIARMAQWLASGRQGDMDYLTRHLPFKERPELLLPGVRSAIVVIKSYKNRAERRIEGELKIARYAAGRDYHEVMTAKLRDLELFIRTNHPAARCYAGVDSRPLDERGLALAAGLGFQGRNTMLIRPGLGSYFFIGAMLTTLELPLDAPIRTNCGTCRRCLDACPTRALLENGEMDASKCISYLNIEKKQPLSPAELGDLHGWIFGCDVCQEACPFNRDDVPLTDWPEFRPGAGVGFEFAAKAPPGLRESDIPRNTALHRSRRRIVANLRGLRSAADAAARA
jgi:epoxyqueuosine reductase